MNDVNENSGRHLPGTRNAFSAFCSRFDLSPGPDGILFEDLTQPRLTQSLQVVGGDPGRPDAEPEVIRIRQFHPFGNAMIVLSNAIFLARKLGIGTIQIPTRSADPRIMDVMDYIFGPKKSVILDAKIELVKSDIDPGRTTLVGGFYYSGNLGNLYAGRPSHHSVISGICVSFHGHTEPAPLPIDEPVIHIRSGDIFDLTRKTHPRYGQPPLAYYLRALSSIEPSRVHLVFEDRLNPVIDALIAHLDARQIDVRVYSGDLQKDIEVISSATVLIAGVGTFVSGVLCTSRNIRKVYYFNKPNEVCGNLTYEKMVVRDMGDYVATIMSNNWANTAEQRQFMLDYPLAKLAF